MNRLTLSAQGQLCLPEEALRHLGVRKGDVLVYEKLPGRELSIRLASPKGLNKFIGKFAGRSSTAISIDQINDAASYGWAS